MKYTHTRPGSARNLLLKWSVFSIVESWQAVNKRVLVTTQYVEMGQLLSSFNTKARQSGFTVYHPATVSIACWRKNILHYSFIHKGQRGPVFTNTYTARLKNGCCYRSVEVLIIAAWTDRKSSSKFCDGSHTAERLSCWQQTHAR